MRITKFHIPKLLTVIGLACLGLLLLGAKPADAANPATINFQGKVVNSDGTNVSNGTYSFIFRIYNTASPTMTTSCTSTATCLWQETQGSVSVTNGVFQVELGSVCALTSASCNNTAGGPINYSSTSSLYLTLQFSGDTSGSNGGFMSPLMHITSVPFALQADNSATLGGLASSNFVQLAQGLQTDSSTTNASIAINKTNASGTPNILTLQKSGANVMLIDNNGLFTLQPAAAFTGSSTQSAISQTITTNQTGGTVNGYNQTITVSNASGTTTTNGFNISLTDNTSLANTNKGVNISLAGSNTSQTQYGVYVSAGGGSGVFSDITGGAGNAACGNAGGFKSISICGQDRSASNSAGTGVYGYSSSIGGNSTSTTSAGAGVFGLNGSNTTATTTLTGTKGLTDAVGATGSYTAIGVNGIAKAASSSATTYGGYFALASSSSATTGAALYATNSTVAANIMDLQDNTTSVFTVGDGGLVTASTNSASGFVVKDSSSTKQVFTIDTSGDKVLLGKAGASGLDGKLVFNNATNSNAVTIVTGVTSASGGSGYTLTLPTTGASSSGQCLQSDTGSTISSTSLTFSSCGGGGGSFATTYSTTSQASNTITYSNSGGGALIIQNASTPLTTLFTIQNNAATFNYLTVTLASSIPHLQVFGASSSNYADIYYDAGSSTAFFKASTGTTQIGTGSGAVNITSGTGSTVAITGDANSTFTTTTGLVRLDGPSGVELGTASTRNGDLKFINLTNTNIIDITVPSGASAPGASYTLTLPGSVGSPNQCLQNSGTAGILIFNACGSGTALSVNSSAVGSTANFVNTTATGTSTGVTYAFGSGNVTTVLGNASTSVAGAVTTGSQTFAGDKTFQSAAANSATAFQIQDSVGASIFLVDTTSSDATGAQLNYLTYPGFEVGSPPTGWTATNPTGGTTTLTQNSNKQHTFNGIFSASVAIGANTSGGGGLHTGNFVSAPPGSTTYIVSFYVKISSGTIASNAFTITTTGGAGSCSPASGITINPSGFQRLFCSVVAGAGSITDLKISDNVTTAHTLFIDAVQMQKNTYNGATITTPTVYQLGSIQLRGAITNPLILANNGDSTGAFQVQKSTGVSVITADTLNGQVLLGNASSLSGLLTFNNSSGANTVGITSGNVSTSYTITLPTAVSTANNYCLTSTTSGVTSWSACGASATLSETLSPEFPGATMTGDGTNNTGTMTSDFCGNDGAGSFTDINTGVCNTSGDFHNYYSWTSNGANDYDIWIRWRVPTDFSSFSTVQFNSKKSATGDDVKLTLYTSAGAVCGTATSMTNTATAWQTTSYTISGCSPSAGSLMVFDIHMAVAANGNTCQMGEIPITYNRN